MKTMITTIVLMLLAGSMLTSCDRSNANEAITPPGPDRVTVLEKQVEAERKLRKEAEVRAAGEASDTEMWQLAALGLLLAKFIQRQRANRRPNRRQDYDHYS